MVYTSYPQDKAKDVVEKLIAMKLAAAAKLVAESIDETLAYYAFPSQHWLKIKTNNFKSEQLNIGRQWAEGLKPDNFFIQGCRSRARPSVRMGGYYEWVAPIWQLGW